MARLFPVGRPAGKDRRVNLLPIIFLLVFALMWALPAWWATRGTPTQTFKRTTTVVIAYGALLIGLGWWWQVPLDARRTVNRFSNEAMTLLDCGQIEQAVRSANRVSGGQFAIDTNGTARINRAIWQQLGVEQQEAMVAVIRQFARCSGQATRGQIVVRDFVSGAVLVEDTF